MSTSQKRELIRICTAAVVYALTLLLGHFSGLPALYETILLFLVFAAIGYDVLWRAVRNLLRGQMLDENFLMAVASIGAIVLRDIPEAVAVMLFYQIGEWFQDYAVNLSRKSIGALMALKPDSATVLRLGVASVVDPAEVEIGETIQIKPGERIPLDGVVASGHTMIDTSALTGESAPIEAREGEEVLSGCVNLSGLITVVVGKSASESSVTKILELVENAIEKKSRSERFITRFARYYTPIVVGLALALALLPPLILQNGFSMWVERALIFLVVSCPCALVISVPLSFFGGIGCASKNGILVKGTNYLEALAAVDTAVFDKTGTLTRGVFKVIAVHPDEMSESELLYYAAHAEGFSDHPIAVSLREAYGKPLALELAGDVQEAAGLGLQARIGKRQVNIGNGKYMDSLGIQYRHSSIHGTIAHVAIDGRYEGYIVIADEVKPTSKTALKALKSAGVKKTVMLTGDHAEVGERVAKELGIDEVYADLMPGDKLERLEALLEKRERGTLAFIGDGINDAPVLSRADVGIAMGALGSDAAIEAADVVLMDDDPQKLVRAVLIARKTVSIARQNVAFALGVKALIMILSAIGMSSMWAAVFADVGVMMLAILNALRALRVKD